MRDGTGMIGRIVFTWYEGSELDANAKTWRLMADILNDVGMTLEMLSPMVPGYFLPLACMGTLCKSICGVAGGCSRAALTQHFALRDNLADVSAKDQSQETAVGLIGMLLGMVVSNILAHEKDAVGGWMTWTLFAVFTVLHLYANYSGLRACQLHTLNRQRVNILFEEYMRSGRILFYDDVAKRESILWWDTQRPRIVLGAPFRLLLEDHRTRECTDFERVRQYEEVYGGLHYALDAHPYAPISVPKDVMVSLHHDASNKDILRAYVNALWIRGLVAGTLPKERIPKGHEADVHGGSFDAVLASRRPLREGLFDRFIADAARFWRVDRDLLGTTEWRLQEFRWVDQ
eukprot:TRINITY_DN7676_c0_g1_i8.p1 TRINITY_DN7676_c0_g1~~TRINITY_DN7676_c0_g1_i8.p1  ORF type:complete len:346 (+),score=54.14 TRINITY_DN7676_c0_g1_i8:417-1454(+)